MNERDDKRAVAIMKEITEMTDEDFSMLCKLASQDYSIQVAMKLREMVSDTKALSVSKFDMISCGQPCGQNP